MDLRALIRTALPKRAKLLRIVWLRRVRDRCNHLVFASRRDPAAGSVFCWSSYQLPFIDYPGQQHLAAAKRRNQRILASHLDMVLIAPGEVFSIWQCAGEPTARRGYAEAAALKNGVLLYETGGAICLLSTVLYNVGLLAGLEILERHCHSVDSYGERRYFELGRDAAIEYGYLDLRFRNPHETGLELRVTVTETAVRASLWADVAKPFEVQLTVSTPEVGGRHRSGWKTFRVRTTRSLTYGAGTPIHDDLGYSVHRIPPV